MPWNTKIFEGISKFHEFQYNDNNIRTFKYSGIGTGKNMTIDTAVADKYTEYWQSIKSTLEIIDKPTKSYNHQQISALEKRNISNNNSGFSQRFLSLNARKEKVIFFLFFFLQTYTTYM